MSSFPDKVFGITTWKGNSYVEYIEGNLPIVISVPHGGYLEPNEIPDRISGCKEEDRMSQELARSLFEELKRLYSNENVTRCPHLIVNHLKRKKLDPNRTRENAAEHELADQAWCVYHDLILTALNNSNEEHGFAHLFDIHGQNHRKAIEFGYLLNSNDLRKNDEILNSSGELYVKCSLSAIITRWKTLPALNGEHLPRTLSELVRGKRSFGWLMHQKCMLNGNPYPTFPNPSQSDAGELPYFWGAETTRRYSRTQTEFPHIQPPLLVATTQVESPLFMRVNDEKRSHLARTFAQVIVEFFVLNYTFH